MGGSLAVIRVLDIIQDMGASQLGAVGTSTSMHQHLDHLASWESWERGQVLLGDGSFYRTPDFGHQVGSLLTF